jgi:2-phospho-L-lactate guanylyltransferase
MNQCALVVPLRSFSSAKTRLKDSLSGPDRMRLAQVCAKGVLDRQVACDRIVVCDSDEVEIWSNELGVETVRVTRAGLNASLEEGLVTILNRHPDADLVIAHGDIIDPSGLDEVITGHRYRSSADIASPHESLPNVVIVPDRRRDGTNVLRLDRKALENWTFEYGSGSFDKHLSQARSHGLRVDIHLDEGLALDVDFPEDLTHPRVRSFMDQHSLFSGPVDPRSSTPGPDDPRSSTPRPDDPRSSTERK